MQQAIAVEELRALRWEGVTGGGNAAPWIHLIAVTAALYIVLPRLHGLSPFHGTELAGIPSHRLRKL